MKLLLGIPSPRNIPPVTKHWPDLPCDRLIIKYHKEWDAYQALRNFFLEHIEYTHLGIASDDLVVKPDDVELLIGDIQRLDYPVMSGVCNVNEGNPDVLTIIAMENSPTIERRKFYWLIRKYVDGIIRVGHAGFPLTIIRRDIVEKIDFESHSQLLGGDPNEWGNIDITFCTRCRENDIPMYADTDIYMSHLRSHPGIDVPGVKEPHLIFMKHEIWNSL